MAGTGVLISQSVNCSLNSHSHSIRLCNIRQPLVNNSYLKTQLDFLTFDYKYDRSTNFPFRISISFKSSGYWYSTSSSLKSNKPVSAILGRTGGVDVGNDWMDKVKEAWLTARDALTYTMQTSLLDVHSHLRDILVHFTCYFIGTVLVWFMVPRLLQECHKQGLFNLLSGSLSRMQVSYEKSFWATLEDPVRYLIAFVAFTKMLASQYFFAKAWRIAVIVSTVWFLYRWKTNELSFASTSQSLTRHDRQEMLILDKVSLVGLIVIGSMALSLAFDVAVHSILFVGGIAGVAGALAVRDIFKDVMGGLSMQLSKPFSVGDHIKIGSVEGEVVGMGLTMTSLMNGEEFPVLVPNGVFFDEGIVNYSRYLCHPVTFKVHIQVDDGLDKILLVSNEIQSMLRSNSKVSLGRAAPDCYLSRLDCSFAELTLSCDLRKMNKDELHLAKEDILRESVRIIKEHGVLLENT